MPVTSYLKPMTGRDPGEEGRVASVLELLYDLVFVVAFSIAGGQLSSHLAEGAIGTAILGYVLTTFAAIWAWINFAWFASAFDTDDWVYRVLTLVQMGGVSIIAVGIPDVFSSLDAGGHVDVSTLVVGYVVMRVGMVAQWLRAAFSAPENRATCLMYAGAIGVAQIAWIVVAVTPMGQSATLLAAAACAVLELSGPAFAETRIKATPWHAEHIAERYSLLIVITLGESVVGSIALLQALVPHEGWSGETIGFGASALIVTFAMWWMYFLLPNGAALREHPRRCFTFGYGSMPIYMACAAVGAGLHVVALSIEHESTLSKTATLTAFAVPLAIFTYGLTVMNGLIAGADRRAVILGSVMVVPLAAGLLLSVAGAPLVVCVAVVGLTPVAAVVTLEVGHGLGGSVE